MSQIDCKRKAKSYCSVKGCLNNNKDRSLNFFAIPKDIERRRQWLTSIGRQELLRANLKRKTHVVCSMHFDHSSIKVIKHLKEDAVPTLLLPNQSQDISTGIKAESRQTTFGSESKAQHSTKRIKIEAPEYVIEESIPPFVLLCHSQDGTLETQRSNTGTKVEATENVKESYVLSQKAAIGSETQWLTTDIKVEDTELSDEKQYYTIGTQTIEDELMHEIPIRIAEKQYDTIGTQTEEDKFMGFDDQIPIKTRLQHKLRDLKLERIRLDLEIVNVIKEFRATEPNTSLPTEIPTRTTLQQKLRDLKLERKRLDLEIVNVIKEFKETEPNTSLPTDPIRTTLQQKLRALKLERKRLDQEIVNALKEFKATEFNTSLPTPRSRYKRFMIN